MGSGLACAVLIVGAACSAVPSPRPTPASPPMPAAGPTTAVDPRPSAETSHSLRPIRPSRIVAARAGWSLPTALSRQVVINDGGTAIVAGGLMRGDVSSNLVFRLDARGRVVTRLASLPAPLHDASGMLVAGRPVLFGGGGDAELSAVVRYGTDRRWRVVGHLPGPRSDLSVVAGTRGLLVVGGYDGVGSPRQVLQSQDGRRFRVLCPPPDRGAIPGGHHGRRVDLDFRRRQPPGPGAHGPADRPQVEDRPNGGKTPTATRPCFGPFDRRPHPADRRANQQRPRHRQDVVVQPDPAPLHQRRAAALPGRRRWNLDGRPWRLPTWWGNSRVHQTGDSTSGW